MVERGVGGHPRSSADGAERANSRAHFRVDHMYVCVILCFFFSFTHSNELVTISIPFA